MRVVTALDLHHRPWRTISPLIWPLTLARLRTMPPQLRHEYEYRVHSRACSRRSPTTGHDEKRTTSHEPVGSTGVKSANAPGLTVTVSGVNPTRSPSTISCAGFSVSSFIFVHCLIEQIGS